jgi:hypothetical protein
MKILSLVISIALFIPYLATAQDSTVSAKIDTVLLYQRAEMELQKKIYEEVRYEEPLANKHAGIELNLARLLVSSGQDYPTISGTFSLFNINRSAEVAFPVFYQNGTKRESGSFGGTGYDVPLTLLNVDATYRQFIGKHQDGLYFSAGTRYTYIKGVPGADFLFFSISTGEGTVKVSKVGAYFGIGYRYFTKSGFYWGTSLIYGRYFSGGDRDIQEVILDDSKTIFDFEFLKFGFAF